MAEEKIVKEEKSQTQTKEVTKTETKPEERSLLERFFAWVERSPIDELALLVLVIIGLTSRHFERVAGQLYDAGGGMMERVGLFFQRVDPYLINFLRRWLRIVAGLVFVGIVVAISGGKNLALISFILASIVLIIPLFILTPQKLKKGKGLLSNATAEVVNTFREFMVSLNYVGFLLLAVLCLFFFVPAELVALTAKLGIVVTLTMLMPLSKIIGLKWPTGLVIIWVAVFALQIGLISFPGTIATMKAERRLTQENGLLVRVGIDEDMTAYDIIGKKITVVSKNTTMLASMNVTSRNLNGRTTVLCYYKSDGSPYYLPLVPNINYHVIK